MKAARSKILPFRILGRSSAWSFALAAFVLGCRFNFELLDNGANPPGGFAGEGGTGDGDGDVGDGDSGDGDSAAGGTSGGDGVGGNDNSGGQSSGGDSSAGGVSGVGGDSGSGGDVGVGGTDGSGGSVGSGGTGSGGSSGGGDLVVTTGVDEDDVGAAPGDPSLSLREAIKLANAWGSAVTIEIQSGLTINLTSQLPALAGTIEILGNSSKISCGGTGKKPCLSVGSGTLILQDTEIYGSTDIGLQILAGTNHVVENCYFHDNNGHIRTESASSGSTIGPGNLLTNGTIQMIFINGAGDRVVDNVLKDGANEGIFVSAGATWADVVGNLIVRMGVGVTFSASINGVYVVHNTIVGTNVGVGVYSADGVYLVNNIFTNCTTAVSGSDIKFAINNHNLYYANGTNCSSCATGANSLVGSDPLFTNPGGDDFTLQSTSPAKNAGTDVGEDRNGSTAGLYNETAPDIGYFELP